MQIDMTCDLSVTSLPAAHRAGWNESAVQRAGQYCQNVVANSITA